LQPHRSKVEVIPYGVDLARFAWDGRRTSRVSDLLGALGGKPAVLTAGRLVGYKGQRYLLEACRELDVIVWLVGAGPLEPELKSLAFSLGLGDRAVFWGAAEDEPFTDLLHACTVFVLPSISPAEAFGLVQVEAMACGKPVVNTSVPTGVPWVSQDGVTGLTVPPADAEALRLALKRLLSDSAFRHDLGEAARRRAQSEFDQEKMIQRYWELFRRLAPGALNTS